MATGVKVWYDQKGDFLEVIFDRCAGYFSETDNDLIMKKVDHDGNLIGFSILGVSALKGRKSFSALLETTKAS